MKTCPKEGDLYGGTDFDTQRYLPSDLLFTATKTADCTLAGQVFCLTGPGAVSGNAALSGAVQLLLNRDHRKIAETLAVEPVHLHLGGKPRLDKKCIEHMLFP